LSHAAPTTHGPVSLRASHDLFSLAASFPDLALAPLDARPSKPNRMSIEESGLAMDV
jgi:hypothetical protein